MSSESWNTDCPICGFSGAQDARDGHIKYVWCPVCSYHENDLEDAYDYAWSDMYENAKEELNRDDYSSDEEYEEALEEKTGELIISWAEDEVGKEFRPNKESIPEYEKVAEILNLFINSLSDDYDWYDCIDLNDYDAYLDEINRGKTASWFFGMLKKRNCYTYVGRYIWCIKEVINGIRNLV